MSDIQELKNSIEKLRDENAERFDKLDDKVDSGFSKMNGRVKKLEVSEAYRKGRESVKVSGDKNWAKVALILAGAVATATTAAWGVIQWLLK